MSTIDTSTWNQDANLNVEIEGIPLNSNASIAQTWQALRVLMAAVKGDGDAIKAMIDVMQGATASADGASGLVPKPEAGDQNKVLQGDGTWGTVAAASHTHGNISNAGAIGATSGLPVVTGTSGVLQAGSFGTTAGTVCEGNDFRLSDARTPASHSHGDITNDGKIGSTANLPLITTTSGKVTTGTFGSSANTFCEGNDSRLSDSRTPTTHAHGSIANDGTLGTASRAVVTDGNKAVGVSSVTSTELGYLSGVTSAVQTQLDAKAADSAVVHKTGDETIAGNKTFSNNIIVGYYSTRMAADNSAANFMGGSGSGSEKGAKLTLFGGTASTDTGCFKLHAGKSNPNAWCTLIGKPDGTLTWNGQAVQTSSDERLKTPLSLVPDEVLDAWGAVGWGQFQFLAAIEEKGADKARLHLGLIAQHVKAVFEARGLDACSYGILCHEVHEATEEEDAVDLWMIRYEEALAMEAAYQRRRSDRIDARIAALEEKLNG